MLTFEASQFVKFLPSGQTKPALFAIGGDRWVFRYPVGGRQQLGLASEYMGYRIASWLSVAVPLFCLARIPHTFQADDSSMVRAGVGTATRWIADATYPNLETDDLGPYWGEDKYLSATAAARVADTWMMNYDRRKVGNVAVQGGPDSPAVYFLDFDQAFLAKWPPRPHWIAPGFTKGMLEDRELLSGFTGQGQVNSERAQRPEHFDACVQRLRSVTEEEVEQAVRAIPDEWGVSESDRLVWAERLLTRREIVLQTLKAHGLTGGCS
ncbi:MAG TPA: hypothetical protein VFE78_27735 [Gemmataceae bacterium]|jgi:hypothetical protein|nr:hypothetical protein [Gemmataceae bacterium]